MRARLALSSLALLVGLSAALPIVGAQSSVPPSAPGKKNPLLKLAEPWPDADALKARRLEAEARPLFKATDPLEFSLTANFGAINKDRKPESTTRYPAVLTVAGAGGTPRDIPVKLSARGHFRRMARNCAVVPLRVEFPKEGTEGTPFEGQTTLKLGTGCEDSKEYEQITLREYLHVSDVQSGDAAVVPRAAGARHLRRREVEEEGQRRATRCSSSTRTTSPAATKAASSSCRASVFNDLEERAADPDDAVRVHDRQHRRVDLGAAQRPPDPEAGPHADRGAVRLRPLGLRARAVRGA